MAMADPPRLHCIDLEFSAKCRILSLPMWHGARWHALLRGACHSLPFNLEDLILSCRPERNGTRPIAPSERLLLHLLIPQNAMPLFPDFCQALSVFQGEGEFSARTLEFVNARDAISGGIVWQPRQGMFSEPALFNIAFLNAEASALARMDEWTLQLLSPLRLPLPPGYPGRRRDIGKYAEPGFLAAAAGLQWLLRKLRFYDFGVLLPVTNLVPAANCALAWDDMRYNERRKIALGGIIGQIVWRGRPDFATALALVLGRHFGAGKNPRFGLGFWRIPELDSLQDKTFI